MQTARTHKEQQNPGSRHADRKKRVEEDSVVLSAEKAPQIALSPPPVQRKENRSGLPDELKAGLEQLSGFAMDDVQVHYNSAKPAQLQAYAYAQGSQIHLGPGQERHLPHEAWHVVQQKQGRVRANAQFKSGLPLNDDAGLEQEADVMGMKAMSYAGVLQRKWLQSAGAMPANVIQAKPYRMLDTHPTSSGNVEVNITQADITLGGSVTNRATNVTQPITGSVSLDEYKMDADRSVQPQPVQQHEVPDAMRVHNINASPQKLRLGQLLTYHVGLEAQKRNIPYVIAMDVTSARGPFYEPLGFTDYNAQQPYAQLLAEKNSLNAFILKLSQRPELQNSEDQIQQLIERKVELTQLLSESNMVIPVETLIENSRTTFQQVWSFDRVEEDSRKARSMENAYAF